MTNRHPRGAYPNLDPSDALFSGRMTIWRNSKDKPFGEQDAWTLKREWQQLNEIPVAYMSLMEEEAEIGKKHPFAWDPKFGYLSGDPAHCGTALEIEGTFHLEGLSIIGDLDATLNGINALRFRSSSILEDGVQQAARVFRIGNNATLGITDRELIKRATRIFDDLATQELSARISLVEDMPRILLDAIQRSLALLRAARLLSPGEVLDLLSPLRLASSMGFIAGMTLQQIDDMMGQEFNAPPIGDSQTQADERRRNERDGRLADHCNKLFAKVRLTSRASSLLE